MKLKEKAQTLVKEGYVTINGKESYSELLEKARKVQNAVDKKLKAKYGNKVRVVRKKGYGYDLYIQVAYQGKWIFKHELDEMKLKK